MSVVKLVSDGKFPIEYIDLFALGVGEARTSYVEIIDNFGSDESLLRFGCTEDKFRNILKKKVPKVIGINCFTSAHHNDAMKVAQIVRDMAKNWPYAPVIVIGGTHQQFYINILQAMNALILSFEVREKSLFLIFFPQYIKISH